MTIFGSTQTVPADPQATDQVAPDSSADARPGESFERHLEVERLGRLIRFGGIGFFLEPIASTVLALALWSQVESKPLAFWLVLVWGGSALRIFLWHHARRSDQDLERLREWARAYVAATTVGGALWAAAVILLWPAELHGPQALLLITIVGVAGIVVVTLASYTPAVVLYVSTTAGVALWGLLWLGVGEPAIIVTGTLVIAALMLALAGFVSHLLRERSRLRFELVAAGEVGQAASRAKSQFIANMSHELRTPLNAILGFSELIRDEAFGEIGQERYKSYAADIHNSGRHLLDVINDILDLSKIEAGKMELTEERVDIGKVIGLAVNLVRDSAERGGITLRTVLPDTPTSMVGDERALKQILLNLLSNAIKFTPLGGEVVTEVKIAPTGDLVLLLRDNGIGMSPEDIPRAMTPFGQVDGSLARKFEGTGLGLPLVKSLVERHGGEFRLQSELGVGTTAIATFPAECVRAAA